MNKPKETKRQEIYTFKIEMLAHVFAKDEKEAFETLDKQGGYLADGDRQVTLIAVNPIPSAPSLKLVE